LHKLFRGLKRYIKILENKKESERNQRNSAFEIKYLTEKKVYYVQMLFELTEHELKF
jgi:hypothetical protein